MHLGFRGNFPDQTIITIHDQQMASPDRSNYRGLHDTGSSEFIYVPPVPELREKYDHSGVCLQEHPK